MYSRCIDHYITLYTPKVSTKNKNQTKNKILLSLHCTMHSNSCCMLNVPINFGQPTNSSSSTPLKPTTRIYTHIKIKSYLKNLRLLFITCLTFFAASSKNSPTNRLNVQRAEILLKRKGHGEESKSNKGMLGDLSSWISANSPGS